MEYNKIISVSGMPGLFELLSSKNDGALVRSLDDNKTKFVSSRVHHFSHLESIEVYTIRENVNLADVFNAMKESSEKLPGDKDNAAVKRYFEKVYPDMDFDRVYTSDMKKMVKWFDGLQRNKIDIKLTEPAEEAVEEEVPAAPAEEVKEEKKPAAKKAAKKEPAAKAKKEKAATEEADETAEAKPKKAARKKKED